jgi:lysophospholipase L1-like esterase
MRSVRHPGWLLALCGAAWGQAPAASGPNAQLNAPDVNQLCLRVTQLMEAGGVSVPGLQRAAAPVIENVKQACIQLRLRPGAGQPTYALMTGVRAYLALADAVPKPFPFPETARAQFAELRDDSTRLDSHFRALLDSKDAELRSPDPDNLARYQEANRKLPPPESNNPRVVFLGDSIVEQWRLNEYFSDRDFLNRGINGQTTAQLLARMRQDVVSNRPAAVAIEGGSFDLARNVPVTAIEDNYASMAELAEANKIKPIFASVLPVSDYHKDANPTYERTPARPSVLIKALNDWLKVFCARHGYTYLDFYGAVVDEDGQLAEDLSDDGLHPNAKGYRVMSPPVLEAAKKLLPPPRPPAPAPVPTPTKPKRKR